MMVFVGIYISKLISMFLWRKIAEIFFKKSAFEKHYYLN